LEWNGGLLCYTLGDGKEQIAGASELTLSEIESLRQLCADGSNAVYNELGNTFFPDVVLRFLQKRAIAGNQVRLLLEISPALASLPIELAFLGANSESPLALHPGIHPSRWVEGKSWENTNSSQTVLIAAANPASAAYPFLAQADNEASAVCKALAAPECSRFQSELLSGATPISLQRAIEERKPYALHLICHGDLKPSGGCVILEGARKNEHPIIYADELAEWLRAAGTQLLVLSGCHTASVGSIGETLAREGVPCVLGMRHAVSDSGAFLFSRAFYAALAQRFFIDEAVYQGRTAVSGTFADWSAPVLIVSGENAFYEEEAAPQHNLPDDPFAFIGRVSEVGALKSLLTSPKTRLVTVTGFGGIGKTRLARETARQCLSFFEDGVFAIDCEAISGPEELMAAIGSAIGAESFSSLSAVTSALSGKRILLLLDCFEKLVFSAPAISELIGACPNLKVLVTSRIILGLESEREYALGPFSPRGGRRGSDATALFMETAERLVPQGTLKNKKRKVQALVDLLERVPLAIILGAAQLRYMSIEDLTAQVERRRLQVLRNRRTDGRHSSLQMVVGDSFNLLSEWERDLAIKLSIFRGGFFLEAAEAVVTDLDLIDGVARLRENSLLSVTLLGSKTRYRMLDTIREYVELTYLLSLTGELKGAHMRHFLAVAKEIREEHDGGNQGVANSKLLLEAGNLKNAIEHACAASDGSAIRLFAGSLARLYYETGLRLDFEYLALGALASANEARDLDLIIELTGLLGSHGRRQANFEMAIEFWSIRVEACEEAKVYELKADALLDLTDLYVASERFEEARATLNRIEEIRSQIKDQGLVLNYLMLNARLDLQLGNRSGALSQVESAERLMATLAPGPYQFYVWKTSALIFRECGQPGRGIGPCAEIVKKSVEEGRKAFAGLALLEMARCFVESGKLEEGCTALAFVKSLPRSVSLKLADDAEKYATLIERDHKRPVRAQHISQSEWLAKAKEFTLNSAD
jgi:predicted ATPase